MKFDKPRWKDLSHGERLRYTMSHQLSDVYKAEEHYTKLLSEEKSGFLIVPDPDYIRAYQRLYREIKTIILLGMTDEITDEQCESEVKDKIKNFFKQSDN